MTTSVPTRQIRAVCESRTIHAQPPEQIVKRTCALLWLISFPTLIVANGNDQPRKQFIDIVADFDIPAADIPVLKDRAVHGNGEAALKLSKFYGFVENDLRESDFWLKLSAESGYCPGQIELGQAYIRGKPFEGSVEKGKTWLVAAQRGGCTIPPFLLDDSGLAK